MGNARTFLLNWALARRLGWRIVFRIEDLDGPRIKPGAADEIASTLRWLGIDWDEGPFIQSQDLTPYRAALESLAHRGLAFPSALTRQQIEAAASAPQAGSHEVCCPATLRPAWFTRGQAVTAIPDAVGWRFATPESPEGEVRFHDQLAGPQVHTPVSTIGDFIIWTKAGTPAYQLAVVVDDARQGVTDIVRGDDLLDSAARQVLLYRALGLGPEPRFWHVPLVLGSDGRRLAKRHGDTRVETYRALGVPAEAVIGLMGYWTLGPEAERQGRRPMSAAEFAARLDPTTIPRTARIFGPEDDQWLRSQART